MSRKHKVNTGYSTLNKTGSFDINKDGRMLVETNKDDWPDPPEFLHNISSPISVTSELELRKRREVIADLDIMIACESDDEGCYKNILLRIKDRLKLLWGECNEL